MIYSPLHEYFSLLRTEKGQGQGSWKLVCDDAGIVPQSKSLTVSTASNASDSKHSRSSYSSETSALSPNARSRWSADGSCYYYSSDEVNIPRPPQDYGLPVVTRKLSPSIIDARKRISSRQQSQGTGSSYRTWTTATWRRCLQRRIRRTDATVNETNNAMCHRQQANQSTHCPNNSYKRTRTGTHDETASNRHSEQE